MAALPHIFFQLVQLVLQLLLLVLLFLQRALAINVTQLRLAQVWHLAAVADLT